MKKLWVFAFCAVLLGCSGGKQAAVEAPRPDESGGVSSAARDAATQHVINGSLFETKGDHARAILEFQDALRYDKSPSIYYALAKNYSALNKHSLAIESLREALRRTPANIEYNKLLAQSYVQIFELDSAAAVYQRVVRADSNSLEAWFNLGRLYQVRNPEKALATYNTIIQRFGPQWDVLLQIVELHSATGRFDKAAEAMKEMTALDPGNLDLMQSLARTYVRANKPDDAIAVYLDLLERNPDNVEYRAELGGVYLMKKEYGKALERFDALLQKDSVSVEDKLRVGEMYFGQIERDSTIGPFAKQIFEQISRQHPSDWRAYWFLGAIGAVTKDDSLSIVNFKKVTELASWNSDGWVYLSSVFLEKNDFHSVVTVLESALKVLPNDARVNSILGFAYNRLGKDDEAIAALEKAYELDPKDLNTISQLALMLDQRKEFARSDSLYEQGLRIDPDNHLLLNNYAYSLSERDLQLQRTLQMSKRAVEQQPENQSYLDTIGWVYFKLGNYTEAEKWIKKAIDKGNASAVLYEHLGDIYEKMNDTERALEQWNIAIKLDANNPSLKEKIERTMSR